MIVSLLATICSFPGSFCPSPFENWCSAASELPEALERNPCVLDNPRAASQICSPVHFSSPSKHQAERWFVSLRFCAKPQRARCVGQGFRLPKSACFQVPSPYEDWFRSQRRVWAKQLCRNNLCLHNSLPLPVINRSTKKYAKYQAYANVLLYLHQPIGLGCLAIGGWGS